MKFPLILTTLELMKFLQSPNEPIHKSTPPRMKLDDYLDELTTGGIDKI